MLTNHSMNLAIIVIAVCAVMTLAGYRRWRK